ncbi:MAG: protein-L-isoaspartate O-methyltransferase [Promethearchaeota archaeon]
MDREESLKEVLKNKKKRLLDTLVVNQILKDKRLIKAFMEIPLERFIPDKLRELVKLYEDVPNLFYYDEHNPKNYRTISAPHMITIMLQGLSLESNDDLLILGAKSGYIAALAHHLAPKGEIVILEANAEIARITAENLKKLKLDNNITIIVKNPLNGMPDLSPWQKILVTGAIEQSKIYPLLYQLDKDGGVLFAPIGQDKVQIYTQILREKDEFYGKQQLQVKFSPLITQVEIDELELITDIDEFDLISQKVPFNSGSEKWDLNKKIEIRYTTDILEKISHDLPKTKSKTVSSKDHKLVLSHIEKIVENILKLKKEENLDECFRILDDNEQILGELRAYKSEFEIKIKKMQQILNQIRSYIIVRKELEMKDLSESIRIQQKLAIINKQIEEINGFLSFLANEKNRIKAV